ncbi:MAG TPA: tRNA epoxyqueuosine(34) reductase QueG [Candidatus Methylomirabilis sp.]|nr:tRNA epoxyqueuosine(34) reductase QueG [Candidatus Methylomirabilis sp.]
MQNLEERTRLSRRVKELAREVGFDLVGVSPVVPPPHGESFAEWLRQGFAGEMAYMERGAQSRLRPGNFLPWAKSIVSVALNYYVPLHREAAPEDGLRGWISRYAWGDDYHDIMEDHLARLLSRIRDEMGGDVEGRAYVDTGPVLEREFSALAGVGWIGKNTTIIHPRRGSWFFLGELFLSLDLEGDRKIRDRCGSCDLCIQACPTGALVGPYLLDSRRCISYLTIELKGTIPREMRPLVGNHVFGCDICQDVCPYNAKAKPTTEEGFRPRDGHFAPDLIQLLALSEDEFRRRFKGSPVRRTKRRGLLRNVAVALGNLRRAEAVPALARALLEDPESLVRGHAAWALGRIGGAAAREGLEQACARESDPEVQEEIRLALEECALGTQD